MFKFVVLSALVCLAASAPAPGLLHGGYALPAATSYSSRVDVIHHSEPIIKTYAAPVIAKTIVAAPVVSYAAPIIADHGYGLAGGLGHGLEHGYSLGHGYDLGHGLSHGYGGGLGHGYGHGW